MVEVKKNWPRLQNKEDQKNAFFLVMQNALNTLRPLVG